MSDLGAVLIFDPARASVVRDSLRTALLGGSFPPGGRRALFELVDALRPEDSDES